MDFFGTGNVFSGFFCLWFVSLFAPILSVIEIGFYLFLCRLLKYFRPTHSKTIYFAIEKRSSPKVVRYAAINNCQSVYTRERESNCKLLRLFVSTLWEVINDFFGLGKWKRVACQVSERGWGSGCASRWSCPFLGSVTRYNTWRPTLRPTSD